MPITLLVDLDDTLLQTDMSAFLPAYYESLAKHLSPLVPPKEMLEALRTGVDLMLTSADPSRTLREVFDAYFYPQLGVRKETLQAAIADYYETVFHGLGRMAGPVDGARQLVEWAAGAGHQLALATEPLFPLRATEERVSWAGLNPATFSLIASFDTFHFSKSFTAYYAELLGRLGWPDGPVLMAGNDLARDLEPAQALGISTYRVVNAEAVPGGAATAPGPRIAMPAGGDIQQLTASLTASAPEPYVPAFKTREAILAVLRATPAVLQTLTASLTSDMWRIERSAAEWAMIELVCHLRDTEREVHRTQLRTLVEAAEPFVSRPDAAVWAKQRRYLNEDGAASVREFAAARMEALQYLASLSDEIWSKHARHSIFGPTSFLEVVSFMADHDVLHLRQAWSILHPVAAPAHLA